MPRKPDPYEYRGEPRKPEETQQVWRSLGYEQTSLFKDGTLEPIESAAFPHVPVRPPPSQRHSPTSQLAAKLAAGTAGSYRVALYRWLLRQGDLGATDEEGQRALGMEGNTYRPRRVELQEMGLVADSKTTRLTRAHRKAVVWVALPLEGDGVENLSSAKSSLPAIGREEETPM